MKTLYDREKNYDTRAYDIAKKPKVEIEEEMQNLRLDIQKDIIRKFAIKSFMEVEDRKVKELVAKETQGRGDISSEALIRIYRNIYAGRLDEMIESHRKELREEHKKPAKMITTYEDHLRQQIEMEKQKALDSARKQKLEQEKQYQRALLQKKEEQKKVERTRLATLQEKINALTKARDDNREQIRLYKESIAYHTKQGHTDKVTQYTSTLNEFIAANRKIIKDLAQLEMQKNTV
jgi:hypothetical protein